MDKIEKYLSEPRLKPYFKACSSIEKVLELYQLNARLSAAFLPLLSLLEVSIRNAFDEALEGFFDRADWTEDFVNLLEREHKDKIEKLTRKYGQPPKGFNDKEPLMSVARNIKSIKSKIVKEKEGFIRDGIKRKMRQLPESKSLNEFEFLTKLNEKVKNELEVQILVCSHNEFMSNSIFGLWTSLMKEDVHRVTKGILMKVFHNKGDKNRKEIAEVLDKIRKFRNRVAHNEPLCFNNTVFDLTATRNIYELCKETLYLLNQDLKIFSEELYIIHEELKNIQHYITHLPIIIRTHDNH